MKKTKNKDVRKEGESLTRRLAIRSVAPPSRKSPKAEVITFSSLHATFSCYYLLILLFAFISFIPLFVVVLFVHLLDAVLFSCSHWLFLIFPYLSWSFLFIYLMLFCSLVPNGSYVALYISFSQFLYFPEE